MTSFNKISLGDVLTDSRRLIKGSKAALLLAFLALFMATMIASFLTGAIAPGWLSTSPSALDNLVANLVTAALTSLLLGGFFSMSLTRARGGEIQGGMIFSGRRFATRFLIYGLVTTAISMVLTVIPFPFNQVIWFAISTLLSFTAYFIVDQDMAVPAAIRSSLALVTGNLLPVLGWLLLGAGLAVVGVFTLGIGLIWIAPFLAISSAMIYRHATDGTLEPEAAAY